MTDHRQHPWIAVACALVFAACAGEPALQVDVEDTRSAAVSPTLEDACDVLGITCNDVAGAPVMLVITDYCSLEVCGKHRGNGCEQFAWAADDEVHMAHELGHALGLDHHDDPDNLMAPQDPGRELTERQLRRMNRVLDRLSACP